MFWGLSDSFQQPFLVVYAPSTLGVASGLLLPVDLIQFVDSIKKNTLKKRGTFANTRGNTRNVGGGFKYYKRF